MIIRVLIINRQLVFAVTIKQALEQTGAFEVHPFTDPNAAMEYLRTHPHDVALVDFDITVMPGPQIIQRLREIQPDIAIIVSPIQPADVVRDLALQDTVDAPFSARGIIPIIEHAAQQVSQPSSAVTRSFVQPEEADAADTEILHDDYADQPTSDDVHTNILPDDDYSVSERAQTRILDDDEPDDFEQRVHTKILDDDDEPHHDDRVHTKILDDDEAEEDHAVPELPSNLPESDPTSIFDEGRDQSALTRDLLMTNILDESDEDSQPPALPEFSSLDNVLNDEAPSALFEPPTSDGDTPAVPDVDSDAVRQFLATSTDEFEQVFDNMLSGLPEEARSSPEPSAPTSEFDELVQSMRGQSQHTPLPDRHQQFVEFILTGGMDGLLTEIEKSQDDEDVPASKPPESSFERLAEEEPPMPTLEESGTVGDLMVGVSDTSFRNVLAMMRGQEVIDEEPDEVPSKQEVDAAYAGFFGQQPSAADDDEDDLPPPVRDDEPIFPPPPPVDEVDSAIPAKLILDTALDESSSLNDLIGDIERQLTEHKPDVMPLPSWQIQSFKPTPRRKKRRSRSEEERYIEEPDFLPEELPPMEEQTVSEFFSQTEDLSDDELDTLGQDLFEEYSQIKAMQRAAQTAAREPEESEFDPSEAFAAEMPSIHEQQELDEAEFYDQETVVNPALALDSEAEFDPTEALSDAVPSVHDDEESLDEPEFDVAEAEAEDEWAFYEQDIPAQSPAVEMSDEPPAREPVTLPDNLWDDVSGDWDETPAWDDEVATSQPVAKAAHDFEDDWELAIDESPADETIAIERPHVQDASVDPGTGADFEPELESFDVSQPDDPQIAQIALSLTQVSLELAAEATLLTNEDEIVAFAGQLDPADIEEIRDTIADDWDADTDQARVRFITLPTTGKDYMLYSRKTVGDFTLSMIFAGTTPLRDIRRQGKRLLDALEAAPQAEAAAPMPAPPVPAAADEKTGQAVADVEEDTLQSFTYLWLLRDPERSFSDSLARVLRNGLNMQLREMGWQVQSLRAQDEYIYIRADVPGERPAYETVDDLKRRAAEIVHAQESEIENGNDLWADSYLVMMPGRELEPDEIEQFINFERML